MILERDKSEKTCSRHLSTASGDELTVLKTVRFMGNGCSAEDVLEAALTTQMKGRIDAASILMC